MNYKRISFFILHFSFFICFFVRGQDTIRKGQWLSADIHYGFIMPLYTSSMAILIQGHVPAFEFDYISKAEGSPSPPSGGWGWQQAYHFPETGIAFFSAYLSNPTQLGNMYGVYPFINFHLNRSFKERLYLRVGLGLGYMPIFYNRLDNHKNNVIGSHLNGMMNMRLNYHFYLSDKARIEAGLGITHCSNGAFQTPDLGLNIITINTGFSYCISSPGSVVSGQWSVVSFDSAKSKKLLNEFIVTAGGSEIEPPGGERYPNYTFSYLVYRRLNSKSKLGIGVDYFYNEANTARLNADSIYFKSNWEYSQIGLKATYELTIHNLALPIEMGGYLYSKFTGNGSIYNRIGLRYYAGNHLILNLTMLTHFAKADYLDLGVGYKL